MAGLTQTVTTYVLGLVSGIGLKTLLDYLKERKLLKDKRKIDEKESLERWRTNLMRAINRVLDEYESLDETDTEAREDFRKSTIRIMMGDLKDLDREAPAGVNRRTVKSVRKIRNLCDEFTFPNELKNEDQYSQEVEPVLTEIKSLKQDIIEE